MTPRWYLARNREKHGPYSMDQLREFAASGLVLPEDMVLEEGSSQWVEASSIAGLFRTTTAITAEPVPAPWPRSEVRRRSVSIDLRDEDPYEDSSANPALWNPNAAASWSLLFTPVFGAYLHAANWRTLGKPEKATANIIWLWVSVAFLAINVALLVVPDSKLVDGFMKAGGLGLLLGWYFSLGKRQAEFVDQKLRDGYRKRPWGAPLGIAFGGAVAYLVLALLVAVVFGMPDPKDLADEVKPLILEEWKNLPEMRNATIRSISLVHKEGKVYSGVIDATIDGRPEKLSLEVVYDLLDTRWTIKPLGN